MKIYFCQTIGDGSEATPFAPVISLYTNDWRAVDARSDPTSHGWMLVECGKISNEQHIVAKADSRVKYFNVGGAMLDDTVSSLTNRKQIKQRILDRGLSIEGLTKDSTVRDILKSITMQLLNRQNPLKNHTKTHYDN